MPLASDKSSWCLQVLSSQHAPGSPWPWEEPDGCSVIPLSSLDYSSSLIIIFAEPWTVGAWACLGRGVETLLHSWTCLMVFAVQMPRAPSGRPQPSGGPGWLFSHIQTKFQETSTLGWSILGHVSAHYSLPTILVFIWIMSIPRSFTQHVYWAPTIYNSVCTRAVCFPLLIKCKSPCLLQAYGVKIKIPKYIISFNEWEKEGILGAHRWDI